MQNLTAAFMAFSPARRVAIVLATGGVFAAMILLAQLAGTPRMALLYSGLEPAAAGEVVQSLEQAGVAHEIRGDAIFVDGAQRDALRMSLAAQGQPANGARGYELLDTLSGFGTTAQMFDAAYWRAKEGELARTIVASPGIRTARVHISSQTNRPFGTAAERAASVTISTAGAGVDPAQARALRFLVSSAVAGLSPDQVSVIDDAGRLVTGGDATGAPDSAQSRSRADALRQNVERLLAARVGAGNSVVEVNIETVTDREEIVERRFDPENRVAISTDTHEMTRSANDTRSGAVTVASNLPDGDAEGGDGTSTSQDSETRERVNYEVSETQREVLRLPGAIRRLSVAVLVDGVRATDATGAETWTARGTEELEALRALVASAVGFNAERGDVITIESLEFLPQTDAGTGPVAAPLLSVGAIDPMRLIMAGLLVAVVLILGLFVLRPALVAATRPAAAPAGLPAPPPAAAPSDTLPDLPPLSGQIDDGGPLPDLPIVSSLPPLGGMGLGGAADETPADRLRGLVEERRDETAALLQSWIDEPKEPA
ncbi:MAG: flagellar basal-body MS-ring/collar protein FliF [Pseudomonadota bacterium]